MIKKIKHIAFLLMAALVVMSCEKEDPIEDNVGLGEHISDFKLETPANFSSLMLNEGLADKEVVVEWEAAKTGLGSNPTYTFLLDKKGGDFSSPLVSLASDEEGIDNQVTVTYGQLIDVVEQAGTNEFIWTVEAKTVNNKGTNKVRAVNSFELDLTVSDEGVTDFAYLTPEKNEKLNLNKYVTPDELIKFTWDDATSVSGALVTFTFQLDQPDGDFSSPVYESLSDNNGADAVFSISHEDLTNMLDSTKYTDGLNWRVVASVGEFEYSPGAQYVRFNPVIPGPEVLYLVGGSSSAGWEPTNAIPFVNISEGIHEIYAYLTAADGGIKFLEGQFWDGDWGMKSGEPGVLEQATESNVPVPADGFYRIYVDFISGTYTLTEVQWGVIGSATPNGWNDPDTDMTFDGGYTWKVSVTLTDGEIKFRANDGWDLNFGDDGADGTLNAGGANIAVTAGTYLLKLVLDPVNGYSYKLISGPDNLYLVGGSTSAGWDPSSSVLFVNNGDGTFEMYTYLTVAGDGFKFLEVQDWAGDWGKGADGELLQEGESNVTVPNDGFYRIIVDFNTATYSVTETNWGIIGSATPNGWGDPDTDMVHSGTKGDYTWTVDVTLTDGEIKFRANDGWDINFGDDGADGSLEYGAANITVSAGTYTITLDLDPVNGYSYTIN